LAPAENVLQLVPWLLVVLFALH